MSQRLKKVQAGRLCCAVLYTAMLPVDTGKARAEKTRISSKARQAMNFKHSWQKLELTLAANFDMRDTHIILTYDDKNLPAHKDDAVKLIRKYFARLRAQLRRQGRELKYIYVTEGNYTGARLHHHVVVNLSKNEEELLQSLWPHGLVKVKPLDVSGGYEELARYLTKEPKEHGKPYLGERMWTPSKNMKKPVTESEYVPDFLTLAAPPGAKVLGADRTDNEYGSYSYIKYLLPEKAEATAPPAIIQNNTDLYLFGLGQCITNERSREKGAGGIAKPEQTW